MKRTWILALLAAARLAGQSSPQALLVTNIPGITSSWAGECGAGVVDNRSQWTRQNIYHAIAASGTGSWSVTLQYSNTACSGPWTSYGSSATINQSSSTTAVAWALDPPSAPAQFINIVVTGNAVATYTAQKQLFLSNAAGNQTITVSSDCTGSGATSISLTCTKTSGTPFGALATAGYPSAGIIQSSGSAFTPITIGTGLNFSSGTLSAIGGSGTGNNTDCVDASGSGVNYTCPSPTPTPNGLNGLLVSFTPGTTSTGSSQTLNVYSLGTKNLVWVDGSTALPAGLLVAGQTYIFQYDGTSFRMITSGQVSGPGPFAMSGATTGSLPSTPSSGMSCNMYSGGSQDVLACVDPSGHVTYMTPSAPVPNVTLTVATSTTVNANSCQASATTVTMTGLVSSMTLTFTPTSDPSGVTGFGSTGGLVFAPVPGSGQFTYKLCNQSGSNVTTSASTTWNVSAK